MRRHQEAIEHYERILNEEPSFGLAHFNLGEAHEVGGDYDAATACYEKALTIMGRQPYVLSVMVYAQVAAGRLSEARRFKEELVALASSSYGNYYFLATACDALSEKTRFSGLSVLTKLTNRRSFSRALTISSYGTFVQTHAFVICSSKWVCRRLRRQSTYSWVATRRFER